MSRGKLTRPRRAALIAAASLVPLLTSVAAATVAADGPGGSVDGSVAVAALVVTTVAPPATPPRAGDHVSVRVRVRNDLPRPVSAVAVAVTGAVSVGASVATLAAGVTTEVSMPVWFCTAGSTSISVTASGLDGAAPFGGAPGQSTVVVGSGPGCPTDPSVDRFPIRVSASPDRSNPTPLDGRLTGGIVHVFVDPAHPTLAASRVGRVQFRLDGGREITENSAPFDLARTQGRSARGLDTTMLANGTHTVTAVVRLRDGATQRSTATFIVDNGSSAKSINYSTASERSGSRSLDGATLGGRQVYVFVGPATRIVGASVAFSVDGRLVRVESQAPYDLSGTARNGAARPFVLTSLRRGAHTVTVEFRLPGGMTITQKASFIRP